MPVAAGSSAAVTFHLAAASPGFTDLAHDHSLDAGEILLFVGTSSTDLCEVGSITIRDAAAGPTSRVHTNGVDVAHVVGAPR